MTSCRDTAAIITAPTPARNVETAPSSSAADTVEFRVLPRFKVAATVSGPLRPNEPVTIHVSVTPLVPTSNAAISIVLPEVAVASRNNWRLPHHPSTGRLPALLEVERPVSVGHMLQVNSTVVIPAPGVYRASIKVAKGADDSAIVDGRLVRNAAYAEVWFTIDPSGGVSTPRFDPTVVPDTLIPQPGPYHGRRRAARPVTAMSAIASLAYSGRQGQTGHGPDVTDADLFGRFASTQLGAGQAVLTYYDADLQNYRPLAGAEIQWTEVNNYDGTSRPNGSNFTNFDGSFDVLCPYDQYTSELGSAVLTSLAGPLYWHNGQSAVDFEIDPGNCSQDFGMIIAQSDMGRTYDDLNEFVAASRNLTGHSRGALAVIVDPGATGVSYFQSNISPYFGYSEKIVINANPSSPNYSVFGDYGRFTSAHEYGHALQEDALGGIYGTTCSGDHYLDLPNTFGCAWREGFADFHAALVLQGEANLYTSYITTNYGTGQSDSPDRETAVGAFLYRVTTANSSGLNYGGYYVTESLRTCSSSAFSHVDGIDAMAYCLAKTIDANGATAFSPFRGYTASGSITNAATPPDGWSASAVQQRRTTDLAH